MKKFLALLLLLTLSLSICLVASAEAKYAWYFPSAHSYGEEVKVYAEQFAE